jgi:hypothetical protein
MAYERIIGRAELIPVRCINLVNGIDKSNLHSGVPWSRDKKQVGRLVVVIQIAPAFVSHKRKVSQRENRALVIVALTTVESRHLYNIWFLNAIA